MRDRTSAGRVRATVERDEFSDDSVVPAQTARSEIELFRCSDTECVIDEVRGASIESPASVAKQVRTLRVPNANSVREERRAHRS